MIKAFRRALGICLFAGLLAHPGLTAKAQDQSNVRPRTIKSEPAPAPRLPEINVGDFRPVVLTAFRYNPLPPPLILITDTTALLQSAIGKRLGVRYRYRGVDNRGYDCSGFVWSVFKETGADFDRGPARSLWRLLPEAKGSETRQFGTLVFFNRLRHIGIVRDSETFYHASRSEGVILSSFSGYWKRRISGFRRAPMTIPPLPPAPVSRGK